ncbi:MAG: carbonic anhydrase [Thermodesulfobacteriota bacterium]
MQKIHFTTMLALALGCAALLSPPPAAQASGGHDAPAAPQKSAATRMKEAVEGNDKFTASHKSHDFDAYQASQAPGITLVSCSDSRVHTDLFGIDPHNNLFVIRNIGNQVKNAEGSVDYGVRHLPTKVLMVLGHSSCGAVKAAMGDYSTETRGIKAELDNLKPVIAADDQAGDPALRWGKNVERNVDFQVKTAMELYGDKIRNGELTVVGAVYDFNNHYGKGRGKLVVTNINGETDPNQIMANPVLTELPKGTVVDHVGSQAPAL